MFRVCVAGKVRLGKHNHPGDAAFTIKLMPGFVDHLETKIRNDTTENKPQNTLVAEFSWVASIGLNEPFCTNDHLGNVGFAALK